MHRNAPAERDTDNSALEKRLCAAADRCRAKPGRKYQGFYSSILGPFRGSVPAPAGFVRREKFMEGYGNRRAESSTQAQSLANRKKCNCPNYHPDLPRVWISNPIEFLSTVKVQACRLQKSNPWGDDNRTLYKPCATASRIRRQRPKRQQYATGGSGTREGHQSSS
jgi:hypothetical protein